VYQPICSRAFGRHRLFNDSAIGAINKNN